MSQYPRRPPKLAPSSVSVPKECVIKIQAKPETKTSLKNMYGWKISIWKDVQHHISSLGNWNWNSELLPYNYYNNKIQNTDNIKCWQECRARGTLIYQWWVCTSRQKFISDVVDLKNTKNQFDIIDIYDNNTSEYSFFWSTHLWQQYIRILILLNSY